MSPSEGWTGWDQYAPFYDWENARTLGRKDIPFWRQLATSARGRVLELGCGTGRISIPLVRAGAQLTGIDRSVPMLARAAYRSRPTRSEATRPRRGRLTLVRGDIRMLPFRDDEFSAVLAPYGVLQSILRDADLSATLASVARVLRPGGLFGVDLVPDVPNWREYTDRIQLSGRTASGGYLTLRESVRQDRRRRLTTFEQTFVERRGRATTEHRFELTFRTLPIPVMVRRLERAGFGIDAVIGDYRGRPWHDQADVWIVLARRV